MNILIIGGGRLAYYLIKTLNPMKHAIRLIELRKDYCERIATDFDVDVYNGDGTNMDLLDQAGCGECDFVIAITGKDQVNLVACEIAKRRFGVRQTVAKVNNPKNIDMFVKLGVDRPVSSTQVLADLIEQEVDFTGMRMVLRLQGTTKCLVEFTLSPKSTAVGKRLREYTFPGQSRVVVVTRTDGTSELPGGDLMMKAGDVMIMSSDQSQLDALWKRMVQP